MLRLMILLLITGLNCNLLRGDEPELIKKAAKAIDLSQLPLYGGEKSIKKQRVECLYYRLLRFPETKEIAEFHRNQLLECGGTLIPHTNEFQPHVNSQKHLDFPDDRRSISTYTYYFSISKFFIKLEVRGNPLEESVEVKITNSGQIEAHSLPRNSGSKLIRSTVKSPEFCAFTITPTAGRPYEKIVQDNHDLFIRSGWSYFGNKADAGNDAEGPTSFLYRKDAVYLTVLCHPPRETGQRSKRTAGVNIAYHLAISSFDEPALPENIGQFELVTPLFLAQLPYTFICYAYETTWTEAEFVEYYRAVLEKQKWNEIPPDDQDVSLKQTLIFENYNRDRAHFELGQKNGKLVVNFWLEDRLEILEHENRVRKVEDLKRDQQRSEPSSADIFSAPP